MQYQEQTSSLSETQIEMLRQGETVYTDTLSIRPASHKEALSRSEAFTWGGGLCLGVCILFFVYRRWLRGQADKLFREKQQKENELIQEINHINRQRHQLFAQYITNTPIYREITRLIEANKETVCNQSLLSEHQWEELYAALNSGANDFTLRLSKEHPALKTEDIRFCCLIKAGFKYADIARVMGRTPNMMYKRREIVSGRMSTPTATQELTTYLRNY